jgi:hypothetical protein
MTKTVTKKVKPLIHTSIMTGKLDGFKAISTNTLTNPFCIKENSSGKANKICTKCYSHTMLTSYRKNMAPALQRNSEVLANSVLPYEDLPVYLDAFLRIDAHGELINLTHLENIVRIAKKNPHCNVALWTKRNDIVAKYFATREKPKNFILVFSNPQISNIMKKLPKHFDKTFNNVLEHEEVEKQNCTGQQCKNCLLCYTHNDVTTIVEKVKKY